MLCLPSSFRSSAAKDLNQVLLQHFWQLRVHICQTLFQFASVRYSTAAVTSLASGLPTARWVITYIKKYSQQRQKTPCWKDLTAKEGSPKSKTDRQSIWCKCGYEAVPAWWFMVNASQRKATRVQRVASKKGIQGTATVWVGQPR